MKTLCLLFFIFLVHGFIKECRKEIEVKNPLNPQDIKKFFIDLNNVNIPDIETNIDKTNGGLTLKGKFIFNVCKPIALQCTTFPPSIFISPDFCFEPGKMDKISMDETYNGATLTYTSPEQYQNRALSTTIYAICNRNATDVNPKVDVTISQSYINFYIYIQTPHSCRNPLVLSAWQNFLNGLYYTLGVTLVCCCICCCCLFGGGGYSAVKRYRVKYVVYEEI